MLLDSAKSAEYATQPRVWAEIDLVAFAQNLREIRERSHGARVLLVVKANAYGHGVRLLSKHALRSGIAGLCVATATEAAELRATVGMSPRIIVLGPWLHDEAETLLRTDVELCLHRDGDHVFLEQLAAKIGLPARVHLNVDTGMGRLGLSPPLASAVAMTVRSSSNLEWVGTMTHLASAQGQEDPIALAQLAQFDGFCREVAKGTETTRIPMPHVEASSAVFSGLKSRYGTIRPGIAAYGSLPQGASRENNLTPILSLRTRIASLRNIERGHSVGYESTWRAARPTRIATLPLGYADGLPWRVAGKGGFALVRGRRVPIVGRVSMDMTTLDVTDLPDVQTGDVVTLIGSDGSAQIRCEEIAEKSGTLPYEIFCGLGPRVLRVPVREEEALESLELPRGEYRPGPGSSPRAFPADRPTFGPGVPSRREISGGMAQSLPSATHGAAGDSGPSAARVDQES